MPFASRERLLEALFESGPDALLLSDAQGHIQMVNRQAEELFGYAREEMVGLSIETLVPQRFKDRHVEQREDYNHQPKPRPIHSGISLFACRRDGSEFPVEISLSPIRIDGELYIASAVRDVTERNRAQEALRRAELERANSMGQMAAYVAHQLNTPLTNVALLTAAAARKTGEERVRADLKKIDEQRRIAVDIVQDLMRFARVSKLRTSPVDARVLVDDAVERVRAGAHPEVTIETKLPDSAVPITVDRVQMTEVFVNLLKNAIDATRQGQITVLVENHGPAVRISVRDTGTGMSTETVQQLFQPFFTTKERGRGTGLGLAFARNIVGAHGGTISVDSAPGRGSTFIVSLPVARPSSAAPSTVDSGPPGSA